MQEHAPDGQVIDGEVIVVEEYRVGMKNVLPAISRCQFEVVIVAISYPSLSFSPNFRRAARVSSTFWLETRPSGETSTFTVSLNALPVANLDRTRA